MVPEVELGARFFFDSFVRVCVVFKPVKSAVESMSASV